MPRWKIAVTWHLAGIMILAWEYNEQRLLVYGIVIRFSYFFVFRSNLIAKCNYYQKKSNMKC